MSCVLILVDVYLLASAFAFTCMHFVFAFVFFGCLCVFVVLFACFVLIFLHLRLRCVVHCLVVPRAVRSNDVNSVLHVQLYVRRRCLSTL